MARPSSKDGIRAKVRTRDGIILIHFAEYPGHWIASPEYDRARAIAWARRNRDRLIRHGNQFLTFISPRQPRSAKLAEPKLEGHSLILMNSGNNKDYKGLRSRFRITTLRTLRIFVPLREIVPGKELKIDFRN